MFDDVKKAPVLSEKKTILKYIHTFIILFQDSYWYLNDMSAFIIFNGQGRENLNLVTLGPSRAIDNPLFAAYLGLRLGNGYYLWA